MQKSFLQVLAIACLAAGISACNNEPKTETAAETSTNSTAVAETQPAGDTGVMVGGASMLPSRDIVDNAAASADHTTLVTAVQAAGLVETLKGAGPFTVFAPTNDAFGKLPAGTVENLLKPETKAELASILTYHVVAGAYKAADLKDGQKLKTQEGTELTVTVKEGRVMIDGTTVTIADVLSSNGVTHVIDGVMLPKK